MHVPQQAGTVWVRIQVIDMTPSTLDLEVPLYISVKDLTQRVAVDSGLGAYWEDGTRRIFYLRARGRVLGPDEKLQELGIVPYELMHLLPQPPAGSGVQERPPEYPAGRGYSAKGNLMMVGGLAQMAGWAGLWLVGLSYDHGVVMSTLPAIALGLHVTSFARHMWGGNAKVFKIPVTGVLLYLPLFGVVTALSWAWSGAEPKAMVGTVMLGFIGGLSGVLMSWLAWFGAVEPLPDRTVAHAVAAEQQAVYQCGICGLDVPPDVRADCVHRCGRVFHSGCYAARQAVWNNPGCAVCGWVPGTPAV